MFSRSDCNFPSMSAVADTNFSPWADLLHMAHDCHDELTLLNNSVAGLFLYRASYGTLSIVPKEWMYPYKEITDAIGGKSEAHVEIKRAVAYLRLFTDIIRTYFSDIEFHFAIMVSDGYYDKSAVPLFAFQKQLGTQSVLIPDPDLVYLLLDDEGSKHFSPTFRSDVPLAEKKPSAIFVGATTGQPTLDRDEKLWLLNERYRYFHYLRGSSNVRFELPAITPNINDEVRLKLTASGLGSDRVSWSEQFSYKILMSLDGNGATCSRVMTALMSNSVLMKAESGSELYYFPYLRPFIHYIPMVNERDAQLKTDIFATDEKTLRTISNEASTFSNWFFHRDSIREYCTEIMWRYVKLTCYGSGRGAVVTRTDMPCERMQAGSDDIPGQLEIIAHLGGRGNQSHCGSRLVIGDGLSVIEGLRINLIPTDNIVRGYFADLTIGRVHYRVITNEGDLSEEVTHGRYSGTTGSGKGIRGFAISISGAISSRATLRYRGVFLDDEESLWMEGGQECRSPSNSILVKMEVEMLPKYALPDNDHCEPQP